MKVYHIITYINHDSTEFYTYSAAAAKFYFKKQVELLFTNKEDRKTLSIRDLSKNEKMIDCNFGSDPKYVHCEEMGILKHLKLLIKYHSQMTKI